MEIGGRDEASAEWNGLLRRRYIALYLFLKFSYPGLPVRIKRGIPVEIHLMTTQKNKMKDNKIKFVRAE